MTMSSPHCYQSVPGTSTSTAITTTTTTTTTTTAIPSSYQASSSSSSSPFHAFMNTEQMIEQQHVIPLNETQVKEKPFQKSSGVAIDLNGIKELLQQVSKEEQPNSLSRSGSSSGVFQVRETNPKEGLFSENYMQLMKTYQNKLDEIDTLIEKKCVNLVLNAKIPRTIINVNETDPSFLYEAKLAFVHAMNHLQEYPSSMNRQKKCLPKFATDIFKQWFHHHFHHPYPEEQEKKQLSEMTGVDIYQISNWFTNYRKRVWKPQKIKRAATSSLTD